MRPLPLIALIAVLGAGIWYALGEAELPVQVVEEPETTPGEAVPEANMGGNHSERLRLKTGTLAISVRTIGGEQALLAEIGYLRRNGSTRWLLAPTGRRVITDAPLGSLVAVARAAGYGMATQACEVIAGVPADVVIILRPGPGASKPVKPAGNGGGPGPILTPPGKDH